MNEKLLRDTLEQVANRGVPQPADLLPGIVRAVRAGERAQPRNAERRLVRRAAWAGVSLLALLVFGSIAYAALNRLTLTVPKSVLIGEASPYVRLPERDLDCTLNASRDRMSCEVLFEGEPLVMDVTLDNGMHWGCTAHYEAAAVPCRASFDALDMKTYVIVDDSLGVEGARWLDLVRQSERRTWTASDWKASVAVASLVLSFAAAWGVWRWLGRRAHGAPDATARTAGWAALAGAAGVAAYVLARNVLIVLLLLLRLID